MQLRRVFRYFAQVLIVSGAVALVMGGCSRQGEGERCDRKNAGDSDCDADLYCKTCDTLAVGPVDRCCRRDERYTDERCMPGNATICYTTEDTGTGGTTSTGGTGGTTSTGGTGGTAETGGTGGTDMSSGATGGDPGSENAGAGG